MPAPSPAGGFFDFAEGRWDRSRWISLRNPDWDRGTPVVHPGDGVRRIPIDKVAWLVTRFEPKTRHELSMTVERMMHPGRPTGQMTVRCGGHEVGFRDPLLPEKFRSFMVTSGN